MSDNSHDNAGQTNSGAAGAQQNPPRLSIVSQFIKDLSFENPKMPVGGTRPEIQIQVDVQARKLSDDQYEITLQINTNAKSGAEPVFVCELSYAGLFALQNIPADSLNPLLMIECPRLLFPFVRRIIADVTRDGGFPPLLLDPIDFVGLYRQRVAQAQAAAQQAAPPTA